MSGSIPFTPQFDLVPHPEAAILFISASAASTAVRFSLAPTSLRPQYIYQLTRDTSESMVWELF